MGYRINGIPAPRDPAEMRRDFRRRCDVRADAIARWNYDIARWAAQKIDEILDEYLRSVAK